MKLKIALVAAIAAVILASPQFAKAKDAPSGRGNPIVFDNVRAQASEFIREDDRIVLTSEQEKIKKEALSKISAPCCADYSMATCCCPCNLAKSTWGLSKLLITQHHATASQVKQAVNDWLAFVNSDGFTGNACFTGGCGRAFHKNGCGGMDAKKLIAA